MKRLLRPLVIAALVGLAAFGAASVSNNNKESDTNTNNNDVSIDGGQNTDEQQSPDNKDQTGEEASKGEYSYTAQKGDSYSKVTRKAVQTYGANNGVNLSQAQIIAAETFLTSDAGFPSLNLGEAIELDAADVKAAVEKAQNLSDAAKARWQRYVPGVDFNTDNVGE